MAKADLANMQDVDIKARFMKLDGNRSGLMSRARECAKLTIPQLLPPEGSTAETKYDTPWQSLGARGVNNLASKLILALFPPNQPFFRYKMGVELEAKASKNENEKALAEASLSKMEQIIVEDIEGKIVRTPLFEALKHLVVVGNTLIYIEPKTRKVRVFRLDQYVVKRDPMGNLLEIITKESISPVALSEDIKKELSAVKEGGKAVDFTDPDAKPLDLYTRVVRQDKSWLIIQEISGVKIMGTSGSYTDEECPYIALRWSALVGEDYGRGLVEEYLGDLFALEDLSKSLVEGAAGAAKLIFLVNPNGTTDPRDLESAANLEFVSGNEVDITTLQSQKSADFQFALNLYQELKQRLSFAFLLNTSIQRSGERVTAEEIRYMAKELEDTLGGTYSVLSMELQHKVVVLFQNGLIKEKKLPALPKNTVQLLVITGLEALGRSHELVKLSAFMQEITPIMEAALPFINIPEHLLRLANAVGVDPTGFIKTQQEIDEQNAQAQQAQQQEAMMNGKVPAEVAKGIMQGVNTPPVEGEMSPMAQTMAGGQGMEGMAQAMQSMAQPQ